MAHRARLGRAPTAATGRCCGSSARCFVFIFVFVWLRGSLPRLRYDQFMALGWKVLIPISLVWIVAVATIRVISLEGGIDRTYLVAAIGVLARPVRRADLHRRRQGRRRRGRRAEADDEPLDAFAGGFPVPPMPAGGAVRGAAAPLTFATRVRTTVTASAEENHE